MLDHLPFPASPPATQSIALPEPFTFYRGGQLCKGHVAFETWGRLNKKHDNAVLIYTGLSPTAHAASSAMDQCSGWWEFMIGPGKPIDTNRWFVICVNSLGSCFGSTGPASVNPETGELHRLRFPSLSVEDISSSGYRILNHLDIDKLDTVIGTSMGGMAALAMAVQFPDSAKRMVNICGSPHATASAIAIRSLQREIIRNDSAWNEGNYAIDKQPVEGVRLARKLGIMSYRSAEEWEYRFGREKVDEPGQLSFSPEFQIESYLDNNARKFVGRFDANSYLYLSRAIDWFDLAEHGGTIENAFNKMRLEEALIIGVESDRLFPIEQQQVIADSLTDSGCQTRFERLNSLQGHDAFLVDERHFAPILADFFGQNSGSIKKTKQRRVKMNKVDNSHVGNRNQTTNHVFLNKSIGKR